MKAITILKLVLTAVSLTSAAYYRPAPAQAQLRARPAVFRPGVTLQRPYRRLVQAASHRAPYVLYRSPPQHRYAVKQFSPTTARNLFAGGPWKTALPALPAAPTPARAEFELIRAASAPAPVVQHGAGAIHTIPAPDLSLAEKPIVVLEAETLPGTNAAIEQPKPSYEVTEKYLEPVYQMANIGTPLGFSKMQSMQQGSPSYLRSGAALQLASEYGLSAISVPHRPSLAHGTLVPQPQLLAIQGFHGVHGVPPHQELLSTGSDSVMIPPNALYQSDPLFLQKLQQQLLQRFPALEFVPYAAELVPQNQNNEAQAQELFLLENEEIKQPEPFISSETKNVFQRETPESSLVTLTLPQPFVVSNVTERVEPTTGQPPHNITLELVAADSQPVTTTIKYVIESNTEPQTVVTEPENMQNTTPIYYAQIGQSVGSVLANGFYSAMNDIRAASALEQVAVEPQTTKAPENSTTAGPIMDDMKQYSVQNQVDENKTVTELKPLRGVPFAKAADSVKVAYTLLRTEEKEPKKTQEGAVYAGQIVEASISEDQDFNNQKATLMKRAPIRLYVTDKESFASSTPKATPVKAKIPPKSKLTFDDKTGEPVLRIYASYVDSPAQRQAVTAKLATAASVRPASREAGAGTGAGAVKYAAAGGDKSAGFGGNQLTKFGVKLRARSDDYVPIFEEYDY